MGKNFRETLNEQLLTPAFKAEWEVLEPMRQTMLATIKGCAEQDLTVKEYGAEQKDLFA